jgi:hypothetical protein
MWLAKPTEYPLIFKDHVFSVAIAVWITDALSWSQLMTPNFVAGFTTPTGVAFQTAARSL